MLTLVIEGFAILGERARAAQLYPLARELLDTGAVALRPLCGLTETAAGIAAATANQWESCEAHFQAAMQQAKSLPNHLEAADINRFHAMMLIDRAAAGDRENAQTLLREALESYTKIGMPRHIEMIRTLLDRATGRQE